jgi:hypothetical protein
MPDFLKYFSEREGQKVKYLKNCQPKPVKNLSDQHGGCAHPQKHSDTQRGCAAQSDVTGTDLKTVPDPAPYRSQ